MYLCNNTIQYLIIFLISVNSIIKMNIKTEYVNDAQGKVHFGIKSYRYNFDYGERIIYVITNLFKGNPELSKYSNSIIYYHMWEILLTG